MTEKEKNHPPLLFVHVHRAGANLEQQQTASPTLGKDAPPPTGRAETVASSVAGDGVG